MHILLVIQVVRITSSYYVRITSTLVVHILLGDKCFIFERDNFVLFSEGKFAGKKIVKTKETNNQDKKVFD